MSHSSEMKVYVELDAYNEMLQKLPIFSFWTTSLFYNKPAKSVSVKNKFAWNEKQRKLHWF